MAVDVGGAGLRGHQGDVIKNRQHDPPVEEEQAKQPIQDRIGATPRFGGVCRLPSRPAVFDPGAEPGDAPGQAVARDDLGDPGFQALGLGRHMVIGGLGHDLLERGPHGGHGEGVAGQGAADAGDETVEAVEPGGDLCADRRAIAVNRRREAPGKRLAQGNQIGLQAVFPDTAARPGADAVGLIDDQQGPVIASGGAQRLVKSRLGKHQPDIGQRRFAQHTGDIALGEGRFDGGNVVEFDHAAGLARIDARPHVLGAGAHDAVLQGRQGLVETAVITAVEKQHAPPAGDRASDLDGEAVGVGGAQGELPMGQAEARRQALAHMD